MVIRDKTSERLGMNKVYTGGTFDLYHAGHARFLRRCHELGSVTVSLNTDDFIEEYKGKPPVLSYADRAEVLLSTRYVDQVVPNSGGPDSRIAIEAVEPDIIAIGSDWARRDYYTQMAFDQDWLDDRGIALIYIPYTQGISSTAIKERMLFRR
jgi:glycerol-3-phosphate cytidylyltransferase